MAGALMDDQSKHHARAGDDHRAALVAGFLGWTLDAFDFFLVVFTLTAIAKEFGKTDAELALTLTVTLAFRPVGAFIGGLPALLTLYVRFGVKESEVWKRTRHATWGELGRGIASHWKTFLYLTLLMTMMNFASHGTQDMYPTFLQRDWGFSPQARSAITAVSMVGAIAGGILFGLLSDRWGRRRAMILAFACAILIIPLWAFAPTLALLIAGAFLLQFMVQGAWGVIPAHITELSPDSVRGFLPGFAYQCGVLIASAGPYLQARLAKHLNYSAAMALTAFTVFVLGITVIALGRERRGAHFGSAG